MASLHGVSIVVLLLLIAASSNAADLRRPPPSANAETTPPVVAPGPPIASTCMNARLNFEYAADGTLLEAGSYIENEWLEYGLTLSASGGFGDLPRLFDSSVYRDPNVEGGDADLGAPNQACKPPGPGRGAGGAPGMEGENCDPLGNVLIIQEEGVDIPDDSGAGGEILFDFVTPAKLVSAMDFLDIDRPTMVWVTHETDLGEFRTLFELPLMGDNSWQTLEINIENVKQIEVEMSGSGAVTSLSFCFQMPEPTLNPTLSPTKAPSASPTGSPTASPTKSPTLPPTGNPTTRPTNTPTGSPTLSPTGNPTTRPTSTPTQSPTLSPTNSPTGSPTGSPSASPTRSPTQSPTLSPTGNPTTRPTSTPTQSPTSSPTNSPTGSPTGSPSASPTRSPTKSPTASPTVSPTASPTASPTSSPTTSPTDSPTGTPTPPPTPRFCANKVMIDFETAANGTQLRPGLYVENEWADYGLTLSASGGEGDLPRLFDTANPLVEDTGGDFDLGAPNRFCSPSGPGRGEGGEPGMPGENCDPLGNVLIIQEEDVDVPDDNFQGGMIVFDFAEPVEFVYAMGFLDVDEEDATVTVTHIVAEGLTTTVFELPLLGDNSKQTLDINIENVTQIKLTLDRSGAVTFISFCPAPRPPYVVDFETAADGSSIPAGAYLENEWTEVGLTLSASGGFGTLPRVLDSSNPGNEIVDGPSLGSPNERCSLSGPGVGEGGEPDAEGENCNPLENVLIVDGVGNPAFPISSVEGGLLVFEFEPVAPHVYEVGLLDIDVGASFTILYENGEGLVLQKIIQVPALGVNSYQTVDVDTENVKMLVVSIERSGAVTFISFDPPILPSPSTPAPFTVSPPTSFPPIDMSMSMPMSMSMAIETPMPEPPTASPPTLALPTSQPPTPELPTLSPPTSNDACEESYALFVECTVLNFFNCTLCNRSFEDLVPGENCEAFETWYNSNIGCCTNDECGERLDDFYQCKNCDPDTPDTPSPIASPSAPTRAPVTAQPSKSPTFAPVMVTPEPTQTPFTNVTVTCDTTDSGIPLEPGTYVENEWAKYGLIMSASGGENSLPRVFDTSNPGSADLDLGAPNAACSPSGPGIGEGGAPGMEGENCEPLGNVLIVQQPGVEAPNDNVDGGEIVFDFFKPAKMVYEMGFLDIDYASRVTVEHTTKFGDMRSMFDLPLLGDNSKQTLQVGIADVHRITVEFSRSGAVTFITFACEPDGDTTLAPAATPTVIPTSTPTVSPTTSSSPPTRSVVAMPSKSPHAMPTMTSPVDTVVNFDIAADGESVPDGAYVEFDWADYGMTLSAVGGFGTLPRIVDTTNPSDVAVDLGSPNERCSFQGPGVGEGGEPDTEGENCRSLGNVIVVQDKLGDTSIPNDTADGGMIIFDFEPAASTIYELELLDIDAPTTITTLYLSNGDEMLQETIAVPVLGVNSFQKVPINAENVKMLAVNMVSGGAVASISFSYIPAADSPTPVPTDPPVTLPPSGMSFSMSMSMDITA